MDMRSKRPPHITRTTVHLERRDIDAKHSPVNTRRKEAVERNRPEVVGCIDQFEHSVLPGGHLNTENQGPALPRVPRERGNSLPPWRPLESDRNVDLDE